MISREEMAYRARLLGETQRWARVQMPALLRSVHAQRLAPLLEERRSEKVAVVTVPSPETGGMKRLDTAMLSIVKLLPANDTRALVSQAIRWFKKRRGCLPATVALNPLRCLALNQSYFSVDCDDLGCYTVEVCPAAELARDVVECMADWYIWNEEKERYIGGRITDFYL